MTAQIATYNGRSYKLVWRGKTKFGERAKRVLIVINTTHIERDHGREED